MTEIWIKAYGFPKYSVSSLGRVRRDVGGTSAKVGRMLKAALHYRGYYQHGLSDENGITRTVRLNRLVCSSFYGPPPSPDHAAAHVNGDRGDNSKDNLKWATKLENEEDKDVHGTRPLGSKVPNSKLSESDVEAIISSSSPRSELARMFGVSWTTVDRIRRGLAWSHLSTQA